MRPDKLMFVHIPKTAGTTIRSYCGNERSKDVTYEKQIPHNIFDTFDLVLAHRPIRFFEAHPNPGLIFTILREPASRLISHFRHLRRQTKNPLQQQRVRSLDFATFVREVGAQAQSVFITGLDSPSLADIRDAIDRRFWFAAPFEYLWRVAEILSVQMHWPVSPLGHFNASAQSIGGTSCQDPNQKATDDLFIDDDARRLVQELYAKDYYAYAHAMERFVEKWVIGQELEGTPDQTA